VAKTPISILTREILQYASTIDEAVEIAKKREVFVSESIMIGSAKDGKAALIEVSPTNFGVYEVENTAKLICSNHFQSEAFEKDKRNLKTIEESHSQYRFDRMNELLTEEKKINPTAAVAILRNRKGLDDTELGFGNEKALNQLLAHHGIVFQPSALKVWVSSNPYQLGEFVGYDLTEEFKRLEVASERWKEKSVVNIPLDPFLKTEEYKNYEAYRELETKIEHEIELERNYNTKFEVLTQLNPEYWKAHYLLGRYYYNTEKYNEAVVALSEASKKEIPSNEEKKLVEKYLRKANRKAK
jgi:hypothetical protein